MLSFHRLSRYDLLPEAQEPPMERDTAKHAEDQLAMAKTITSDFVEAFSLCPRKAFLLMTGASPDPGSHEYELLIREKAEVNRQAHQVQLAKADEVARF